MVSKRGKHRGEKRTRVAERGGVNLMSGRFKRIIDHHAYTRIWPLVCFRKTIMNGLEATSSLPFTASAVTNIHLETVS